MEGSHRWTSAFLRRYRRSEPSLRFAGDEALVSITARSGLITAPSVPSAAGRNEQMEGCR